MKRARCLLLALACLAAAPLAPPACAQARPAVAVPPGVRVPAWRELSAEQRRDLIRLADRWDSMPASRRVQILERWQRWRAVSPAERETLRRGEENYRSMSPRMRAQMRRSLEAVSRLPPEEQQRLRSLWRGLTPEERRDWLERGGPGLSPPP